MATKTRTIVFITGAFISHHCWDEWIPFFESRGYHCIAPPWPYKAGTAKELRVRHPDDALLAGLRLEQLFEHYVEVVSSIPEKPVVIGHSMGGLIVQLLVNRGLVAAGAAVHSIPPQGVMSFGWPVLKSLWKPSGFFSSSKKTYLLSAKDWNKSFTNGMSAQVQNELFERLATPESKNVVRDAVTSFARFDYKKLHPPLLLISGGGDNFMPEPVVYNNYLKYDLDHSVTDYKEFPNANHLTPVSAQWHDEADYIAEWLQVINV